MGGRRPGLALSVALVLAGPAGAEPRPLTRPEVRPNPMGAERPRPAPRPAPADTMAPSADALPLPMPSQSAPTQSAPTPPAPADAAACLTTLAALGAVFDPLPPITDANEPACGIARPLRLQAAPHGIVIEGGAVMRCDTALALVRWLRDSVRPATVLLEGAPRLTGVLPGSTYQCRVRRGDSGAVKLSEHATGGAFDVMGLRFATRADLRVEGAAGRDARFLGLIRSAACRRFTTVLGPGSNAAHADHLHVDLAQRNGGFRLCE